MKKKDYLTEMDVFVKKAMKNRLRPVVWWDRSAQKAFIEDTQRSIVIDKDLTDTERKELTSKVLNIMTDWDLLRSPNSDKINDYFLDD